MFGSTKKAFVDDYNAQKNSQFSDQVSQAVTDEELDAIISKDLKKVEENQKSAFIALLILPVTGGLLSIGLLIASFFNS